MASTDMLNDALRLPAEARARLALALLRSLEPPPEPGTVEAWIAEIDRRGAEIDAGTADTMTLDDYRAHVRHRRAVRAQR